MRRLVCTKQEDAVEGLAEAEVIKVEVGEEALVPVVIASVPPVVTKPLIPGEPPVLRWPAPNVAHL